MIRRFSRIAGGFVLAALVGCSSKQTPSYNPNVGPFDEDGNYIEAWADNPPPRGNRSSSPRTIPPPPPRVASVPKTAPQPRATQVPKPKPVVQAPPKPKPKPKPVVVKPRYTNHLVKKGDTLYGLARRYGTTVSAIQRANGLSGTLIRDGKTLKIPR